MRTLFGDTALHTLAREGMGRPGDADMREIATCLVGAGADTELRDSRGATPLLLATLWNPALVPMLLGFGARRDVVDAVGCGVFHNMALGESLLWPSGLGGGGRTSPSASIRISLMLGATHPYSA